MDVAKGSTDGRAGSVSAGQPKRLYLLLTPGIAVRATAQDGAQLALLNGHTSRVHDAIFTSDSRRLISVSEDQTVRIWDATSGDQLFSLQGHAAPVLKADVSKDGRRLVSVSMDNTAKVWDQASGELLVTLRGSVQDALQAPPSSLWTAGFNRTAAGWSLRPPAAPCSS